MLSGRFLLAREQVQHCFGEHFVDQPSALGENAIDRLAGRVAEDDPVGADPQPAVVLKGPLERLHVALSGSKVAKGASQASPRFWCLAAHELDDLRG